MHKTLSLLLLAGALAASCSANPDACTEKEMATVVKVSAPTVSMYYSQVHGLNTRYSIRVEPGFYNYDGELEDYYLIPLGQDGPYTVPKANAELEQWTAAQGHGYVFFMNDSKETIVLRKEPSDRSQEIISIKYEGDIPEEANCLGISGKWYKVDFNGKVGYVKRNLTVWSVSSADAAGQIR